MDTRTVSRGNRPQGKRIQGIMAFGNHSQEGNDAMAMKGCDHSLGVLPEDTLVNMTKS